MAENMYVPQVDYTSKDYASLRDDLINLIPNFAPQWTSRDSSDFGIVLLELFSYVGDVLNYYIDRAANESFIQTSTQRDTVLALADLFNYTPNEATAATGSVTFTNSTGTSVSVLAGTRVAAASSDGERTIMFETVADATVDANSNYTVGVTQGSSVTNEVLGVSDGTADQEFKLAEPNVMTGAATSNGITTYTTQVTVGATVYTKVSNFVDAGPNSTVFTTRTDGDGYTYIKFGDGSNGTIPPKSATVKASYRIGDGALGNVAAGAINNVMADPNGNYPLVSVINTLPTSGGADAESTDSIRDNAAKAIHSLNRAVSLSDYESLALQIPGVAKAKAIAAVYTQVILYAVPNGGGALSTALKSDIFNYFQDKIPPATVLYIRDAYPVYPDIRVTVTVSPQYKASSVQADATNAIYDLLAFDNVLLGDTITSTDVVKAVTSVNGVKDVTVTGMTKKTTLTDTAVPGTVSAVYCAVSELPTINTSFIKVTTVGGLV